MERAEALGPTLGVIPTEDTGPWPLDGPQPHL